MCEMMENILEKSRAEGRVEGRIEGRAEGRVEGRVEGRAEGRMIQLYELVKKGFLTAGTAADEAHQTEAEFSAGMDAYFAQPAST